RAGLRVPHRRRRRRARRRGDLRRRGAMSSSALLVDAYGRIREEVEAAVDGLTPTQLAHRLDPDANSIAWLVWHLTRVEDDHIADVAGFEQVWTAAGWSDRFGLPLDRGDTGYGHSSAQVASVRATAELLRGYQDAVHAKVIGYLEGVTDDDLPKIVD